MFFCINISEYYNLHGIDIQAGRASLGRTFLSAFLTFFPLDVLRQCFRIARISGSVYTSSMTPTFPAEASPRHSPAERLRICCVNVSPLICAALQQQGHDVLLLTPSPGERPHLPELLHTAAFTPDLVLQQELLRPRVLLSGLGELSCCKAFWAVDPHMNAFWQTWYARLFDVTFSTQQRWLPDLQRHGAAHAIRLPWYAPVTPWQPWSGRTIPMAFVGRVSQERPARLHFVQLLREHFGNAFEHAQDLTLQSMGELYARTRIVPNESILGEVNFRLFEATRFGCLVVGQELGPEQNDLFAPGKETLCYSDALELKELLSWAMQHENQATAIARAGWERLRAKHQPMHRATSLVRSILETPRNAVMGRNADLWLAGAACQLYRAGRLDLDPERALAVLQRHGDIPAACALRLQLLAETGHTATLLTDLNRHLTFENQDVPLGTGQDGISELRATASLAALKIGRFDMAKAFWLREEQARQTAKPRIPEDNISLLRFWAGALRKANRTVNTGFVFHEERHVPASALECLAAAMHQRPTDLDILRQMESLLSSLPGQDHARVGLLSTLTLHRRHDWRLGLETGLTNLRAFRLTEGQEELQLALALAREQGAEVRFWASLSGRDPFGRVRRLLDLRT